MLEARLLAYNCKDQFADPSNRNKIIGFVDHLQPTIAFFSEAYPESKENSPIVSEAEIALKGMGYHVLRQAYNDEDDRKDRHAFIGITKMQYFSSYRFYNRDGFTVQSPEQRLKVFGLHADDRNEASRNLQIEKLPISNSLGFATVFMGDLNAIRGSEKKAQLLRFLRPITDNLPTIEPGEQPANLWQRAQRFGSLARRLTEMADGKTMSWLEMKGYQDADPSHQPTMRGILPIQLDHIMVSKDTTVKNFVVHKEITASDHWPISADITWEY